jgi:negative regulator of genetic competence, sporulation and motility
MAYIFIVEGATCSGLMTSHRQAQTKNICEKERSYIHHIINYNDLEPNITLFKQVFILISRECVKLILNYILIY